MTRMEEIRRARQEVAAAAQWVVWSVVTLAAVLLADPATRSTILGH